MLHMNDLPAKVSDELRLRILSGAILAAVGAGALLAGGPWFTLLCALVAGAMLWELGRLLWPGIRPWHALANGVVAAVVVAAVSLGAVQPSLPVLSLAVLMAVFLPKRRTVMGISAAAIMLGSCVLAELRLQSGVVPALWMLLLVAATDIGAYIAGKALGGPRLAPFISPGKRWSGAIGGCVAAIAVSGSVLGSLPAMGLGLVLAVSAQLGDLGESWVKRQAGAKDSSRLIPGHGGFMDRFDGMIGACLIFGLLDAAGMLEWFPR